ncbi:MAG: glycosyltransferase family 2 protein [Candidatus Nealsonbacteria bacterium]|nr:glycosyltransferase family 2 protein [Candidatus Nealsonbacteria bacterium]
MNKLLPEISIIIPTYKRSHLIGRAIQSVLNQTYQNFEIVIIDDSPNDDTEKTIKKFNDKRIKYVRNKIRRGFIGAKNQGVKESNPSSKYIAFLDDDDEWLPQFLEKTIRVLEEKKDIATVSSYAELRSQDGKFIRKMTGESNEFWKVRVGNGSVIRKEIFEKENIWFDEKILFEDLDFGIRMAKNHKWECIPEALRIYYGYPAVIGESHSTSFTQETPSEELEYFYKKNYEIYKKAGKKALAWIHFIIGKTFCRAGKIKEGRTHLLKALKIYPRPEYLFYYLLALFFPKAFKNLSLIILKQKIFRGKL